MYTCAQSRCGRNCQSAPMPRKRMPDAMPDNLSLAMAYVPMQQFKNVYELSDGFQQGTIFPELNKPFMGWKGGCRR